MFILFELAHKEAYSSWDNINGCIVGGAALRRVDPVTGRFSINVLYPPEAIFITKTITALGIKSFYSFEHIYSGSGSVLYQISVNGGSSYLYWNGANWVAPGANDWNTYQQIDAGLPTLPLGKLIKFKIKLLPSTDRKSAPVLEKIKLAVVFEYNLYGDFKESLYDLLAARSFFLEGLETIVAGALNRVTLNSDFTVDISKPIQVFNRNTDPNLTVNLFSSYNAVTKVITLTSNQPIGNVMVIKYYGKCDVIIAPNDADFKVAQAPAVYFTYRTVDEYEYQEPGTTWDFSITRMKCRKYRMPRYRIIPVNIYLASKNNKALDAMASGMDDFFGFRSGDITSLATGYPFKCHDVTPILSMENMSESIVGNNYQCQWFIPEWDKDVEEFPAVQRALILGEPMKRWDFRP